MGEGPRAPEVGLGPQPKTERDPQVFLVPYVVLMEPFDGAQLPTPISQPLWSTEQPHFGSFLALKGPLVGPQICFELRGGVQPLLEGQWRETPPDLFYPKWYLLQIYHIGQAPQSPLQELGIPPYHPPFRPFLAIYSKEGPNPGKLTPKRHPRLVGRASRPPDGYGGGFYCIYAEVRHISWSGRSD